jgi:hypothetical protein
VGKRRLVGDEDAMSASDIIRLELTRARSEERVWSGHRESRRQGFWGIMMGDKESIRRMTTERMISLDKRGTI